MRKRQANKAMLRPLENFPLKTAPKNRFVATVVCPLGNEYPEAP